MITAVPDAARATTAAFDQVIDARSPAEFAQDHVPGAINLPVLDDEERARVGTMYVRDDPFRARRLGAALVARNIARHLEGPLAGHGGGWRPLVYCWRGGQRSGAFATVLSQVGWRAGVLAGGYRTYRREVVAALYADGGAPFVVLLAGGTGVGKTELLAQLAALGAQTLDLEALASHRGSLFGATPGAPQPSQKRFESGLAAALAGLDPTRPVFVEAESSRVGELAIPPRLWRAMGAAPAVQVHAPDAARVRRLVHVYRGAAQDGDAFARALERLPRHIGREQRDAWLALLAADRLDTLAQDLLRLHYDPAYRRSAPSAGRAVLGTVSTGEGSPADLRRAAEEVLALRGCALG